MEMTLMIDVILVAIGVYILIESIGSIWWKYNDKSWFPQLARVTRVISGGLIIWLVLLRNIG